MKKLLTILLILSAGVAFGQNNGKYTPFHDNVSYPRVRIDSVLSIPVFNDTLRRAHDSISDLRIFQGELWYKPKYGFFKKMGGGSNGNIDLTNYYSKPQIDSLYNNTYPLNGNPAGYLTGQDGANFESKAHAAVTFQPIGDYITLDDLSPFEQMGHAAATYADKVSVDSAKVNLRNEIAAKGGSVDLTQYYDKTGVDTAKNNIRAKIDSIAITPELFGAKGDGITNDINAFVSMFNFLNAIGGGRVVINRKYVINNTFTNKLNGILKITAPIQLIGAAGAEIDFNYGQLPLFHIQNTHDAVIDNIKFKYTGTLPSTYPTSWTAFAGAMGISNYSVGGDFELSNVISVFGSSNCRMSYLTFETATRDSAHCINFDIVFRGLDNGAGLTSGNTVVGCDFNDMVLGMLISGQQQMKINNITANRRTSSANAVPGHVIYLTQGNAGVLNDGITINGLSEGSQYYAYDLGTLSLKYSNHLHVSNIFSNYPSGLIQSLIAVNNSDFTNLNWNTDTTYFDNTSPVIYMPLDSKRSNLVFNGINVTAPNTCATVIGMTPTDTGAISNVRFQNVNITTRSWTDTGSPRRDIINLHGNNISVTDVIYTPVDYLDATKLTASFVSLRPNSSYCTVIGKVLGAYALSPTDRVNLKTGLSMSNLMDIQLRNSKKVSIGGVDTVMTAYGEDSTHAANTYATKSSLSTTNANVAANTTAITNNSSAIATNTSNIAANTASITNGLIGGGKFIVAASYASMNAMATGSTPIFFFVVADEQFSNGNPAFYGYANGNLIKSVIQQVN